MSKRLLIFLLVILLIVAALMIGLVEISKTRSNDTIERIDSKIEAVMNR